MPAPDAIARRYVDSVERRSQAFAALVLERSEECARDYLAAAREAAAATDAVLAMPEPGSVNRRNASQSLRA